MTAPRLRVLVVDDEQSIRHLLRLALEEDFEVVEAADGVEGFERAVADPPDIIVSDIMMPRLDGYGLYRKLKSRPETAGAPFVFLSAKRDIDERVAGLEMGAEDYITKPFSIKELKAKIRSLTKKVSDIKGRGSLEGMLREVDLVEVIQLIEMGRKTGLLLLEGPPGAGQIYFDQGTPTFARSGHWTGPDALYHMLSWKDGRFRLEQVPLAVQENIPRMAGQELLMEGVRMVDESAEAQRRMPSPETVLAPLGRTGAEDRLAVVLQWFGQGATVQQALSRSGLPPHLFYVLVARALAGGFLGPNPPSRAQLEVIRRIAAAVREL